MLIEDLDKPRYIVRYGAPNLFDQLPFLSEIYAAQEDKTYIQMNKNNSEDPNWVLKE